MALKNAQTEAGFWMGQPPASLFRANDRGALEVFLHEALTTPTCMVPTPTRDRFPKPKDVGLPFNKGWKALENGYESMTIFREAQGYKVNAYLPDGSWSEEQSAAFTGADAFQTTVNDVFSRMN